MKSIDEIIKERELAKIAVEKKRKEDGNIKRENIKKKYLKEKYRNIEKNINCCPNKIVLNSFRTSTMDKSSLSVVVYLVCAVGNLLLVLRKLNIFI